MRQKKSLTKKTKMIPKQHAFESTIKSKRINRIEMIQNKTKNQFQNTLYFVSFCFFPKAHAATEREAMQPPPRDGETRRSPHVPAKNRATCRKAGRRKRNRPMYENSHHQPMRKCTNMPVKRKITSKAKREAMCGANEVVEA